jgi:hypothetical protein
MKKVLFSTLIIMFGGLTSALAAETTFEPNPQDMDDLTHQYYYSWGINWQIPGNEEISDATLSFDNINNWATELDDILYVNLLTSATPGLFFNIDDQASGNAFNGIGTELFTFTDTDESTAESFSYDFNGAQLGLLTGALADGNFGLGLDPDCHYYNDGVKLKVCTRVVPEPASMLLYILGGSSLIAGFFRKKKA